MFAWSVFSRWRRGRAAFLLLPMLFSPPGPAAPAWAATDPPQDPRRVLTLDDALRRSRDGSLELESARLAVRGAESRAIGAPRRPDPGLELDVENWGGSLGSERLEITAGLSQTLELGGDRRARALLAGAEADAARAHQRGVAREVRGSVIEDFLDAWVAQERVWRLHESQQAAGDAVAAAGVRLRAGAAPAVEEIRARSHAALVEAALARAEAVFLSARQLLALHWGGGDAPFDSLALPAPDLAPAPAAESLAAALRSHPAVSGAAAAVRAAQARALAVRAGRVPDLEARLGWRRLEEVEGQGLVAGLSLPLPIWSAGKGARAAAEADRARAEVERTSAERRLLAQSLGTVAELEAAIASYRRLVEGAVPAAEEALENLRAGYRAGRLSYVDLIEAQRAALEARLAVVEATAEVWRQRARIERLTATPEERGGSIR